MGLPLSRIFVMENDLIHLYFIFNIVFYTILTVAIHANNPVYEKFTIFVRLFFFLAAVLSIFVYTYFCLVLHGAFV